MDRNNLFAKSSKTDTTYPRRIVYASFIKAENNDGRVNFTVAINKGRDTQPEYINHINVRTDNQKRADLIAGLEKGTPMLLVLSPQIVEKDGKEYTNFWLDSFSLGTGLSTKLYDENGKEFMVAVGNLVRVNEDPFFSFDIVINKGKDREPEFVNRITVGKNASENFINMLRDLQRGQTMAIIYNTAVVEKDGKEYTNNYLSDLQLFPRKKAE